MLTACAFLIGLLATLAAPGSEARDQHVLWTVEGQRNTLYLLGSIHVLRPGDENSLIATGFLIGGAHDSLLPKGEVMQLIMRH